MKKALILVVSIFMMSNIVISQQSLRLTFTGQIGDGYYQRMDSIEIKNVTRNWVEVLYYPDTTLVIVSPDDVEDNENNKSISVTPSMFDGEANININVERPSNVILTAHGLSGRIYTRYESVMNTGNYSFKINLSMPQMYILSVQIGNVLHAIKICNIGHGSGNCIVLTNSNNTFGYSLERGNVTHYFEFGDIMDFVGFATYNGSVVSSEHKTQPLFYDENITLDFSASIPVVPQGAISGIFSVSGNCKVLFSQGNLQYTKSTQTWSFMEHQYDRVETPQQDVGIDYANQDIVSLFGWATSNYHDIYDYFNMFYVPYTTSHGPVINPECNKTGYGPSTNMSSPNLTGMSAEYDWGIHNTISNGGNQVGLWRTLTKDEWRYILETRPASTVHNHPNTRFVKATVNGVPGIVLFPDVFSIPAYLPNPLAINDPGASYAFNNYSIEAWTAMENLGCVFLPMAYSRQSNRVDYMDNAYYWSTTHSDCAAAYALRFNTVGINTEYGTERSIGCSVRLVCPVE